jgi:cytochrome c553
MEGAPNLAGESVIYLDTQLKAFRSGKRTNEIMSAIAEGLSDEEIRSAADWYSGIKLTIEPAK